MTPRRLWILSTALLVSFGTNAGCTRIIERAVPLPPAVCHVPEFPMPSGGITFTPCDIPKPGRSLDDHAVCTSPESLAMLAAWVHAVGAWRETVLECPGVHELGQDTEKPLTPAAPPSDARS